jgi:hypothetical protein
LHQPIPGGLGNVTPFDEDLSMLSRYSYGHATAIPKFLQHATDWACYADKFSFSGDTGEDNTTENYSYEVDTTSGHYLVNGTSTFADNGTGMLLHAWHIAATSAAAQIDDQYSPQIGNLNEPSIGDPATLDVTDTYNPSNDRVEGSELTKGYQVTAVATVYDWSVDPTVYLDA